MSRISRDAALTFVLLQTAADDYGCADGRTRALLSALYGMRDDVRADDLDRWLGELESEGMIAFYEADGRRWLALVKWWKYQRRRESKRKTPIPPRGLQDAMESAATSGESRQLAATRGSRARAPGSGFRVPGSGGRRREGRGKSPQPAAPVGAPPADLLPEPPDTPLPSAALVADLVAEQPAGLGATPQDVADWYVAMRPKMTARRVKKPDLAARKWWLNVTPAELKRAKDAGCLRRIAHLRRQREPTPDAEPPPEAFDFTIGTLQPGIAEEVATLVRERRFA